MENHPIPQDVTGFKFRLIGSVTVKQFLYLLGAGVIALVFYLLPFPLLLKIPLMILSGGAGLCLAFVPIDGRPMDKMILNFARTIPAENQFIYKKKGAPMPYFEFSAPAVAKKPAATAAPEKTEAQKKALLLNQLSRSYFKPDKEEQDAVASISNLFGGNPATPTATNATRQAVRADIPLPKQDLSAPAPIPTSPLKPATEPLSKPHVPVAAPVTKTQPVSTQPTPASTAVEAKQVPPMAQPATQEAVGGIDMANIIQGTVFDARGKPQPHVIVEIIDSNNTPLRTFRTGQDGFFRAATPLPNGTYTIHLEDTLKKQEFQDVSVVLNGTITQPVQVRSIDQREKLRQELFGIAA